jgi:hypothetical protein
VHTWVSTSEVEAIAEVGDTHLTEQPIKGSAASLVLVSRRGIRHTHLRYGSFLEPISDIPRATRIQSTIIIYRIMEATTHIL